MAGLLDGFGDFIKTPEGQGLLAATFGGLAGARSGAPINSLGRAGLAGMQGYTGAIDRQQQMVEAAQVKKMRDMQMSQSQMQLDQAKRDQERQAKEDALLPQFYKAATPGIAPLAGDSMMPPEMQSGLPSAGAPAKPASFNLEGYSTAMMGVNPTKGIALMQSMAKDTPFNKLDPKDYTSESLAKFGTTRNYADLVPNASGDKTPTKIQEYKFAKDGGYKGSFEQFVTLGPTIMAAAQAPLRAAQIDNITQENAYNLPPPLAPRAAGGSPVTVTAGGKTYTFPDQKSANSFKMKAGIK